MQFIKTLFWVVLAVVLVVFAANNWSPASVLIWQDVRVDTKIPVLVIGAFLLGFVPLWLMHRAMKWRLTRRIKTLEDAAKPKSAPAPTPFDLSKEQIAKPSPAPAPKTSAAVSPVTEPKATET
ncbi:hypothetical protein [Parasphingorhabdus sp.]|jgi:uncharacterized integral membrane protein|uniref:hypothetical protein n=1 Tax=Parasphingorhabdus sp. TaxID=2709688 RepID=UPI003D2DAFA2